MIKITKVYNFSSIKKIRCMNFSTISNNNELRIGFIGLGNMGFSMSKNLILSKISTKPVLVYDVDTSKSSSLELIGAKVAIDISTIAKQCNVIVTMLPATQHVYDVIHGEHGILKNAKEGTLLIDSSTIDPLVSRKLHDSLNSKSLSMIDAPVSGGVTGAAAGTLTFMVGGSTDNINKATIILNSMGKNVIHCGNIGDGLITKLCNNLSLGIQMIATSEAMNLGIKLGLDPKKLASVLNTSTGRCWSSDSYNPVPGVIPNIPSSKQYEGGFAVGLMEKDLGLALALALKSKVRTPIGAQAHQLYGLLTDNGYQNKDFSVIYDFLKKSK